MVYLRALSVLAMVFFFYVVVAPLQWLALRCHWRLALQIPGAFHRSALALLRIEVVVHDRPAHDTPLLIVSNHVSWTDICALSSVMPVCFLSKKEVAGWPIVATFAKLQRTVFVDRQQARSIVGANKAMVERMRYGVCVVLFPEGTTFDGTELGHFHSSHFAAARDYLHHHAQADTFWVQPVAIRYSHSHVAWFGDAELLPHLLELLSKPPVRCDMFFCEPVAMQGSADRKAIAQACNAAIDARLKSMRLAATQV